MNNSLVTHLSAYVCALFKDIAYAYTKTSDWRRDQARLLHELEFHGHRVMTLDLPAILKHFDKCLANERFTRSGLRYARSKRGTETPSFLGNLFNQIFDADGKLRHNASSEIVCHIRQVLGGLKKLKLPCTKRSTDEAVRSFVLIEQQCRQPTLNWVGDWLEDPQRDVSFTDDLPNVSSDQYNLFPSVSTLGIERVRLLQSICDVVAAQFGDLHIEGRHEMPKHGPGVVSNIKKGRESKYSFPYWSEKLSAIFPPDMYAHPNLGFATDPDSKTKNKLNHELYSKLISVPKTFKTPRLIAAEPLEHQWIQQLVRNQLEARIHSTSLRYCISFADQRPNKYLAIQGSIDGSFATVDLSSASDRLTCWTVERAFRSNWTLLQRLHSCRTRWLRNCVSNLSHEYLLLKKFAPQGSACTFPVQSIIYSCVAIAALHPIGRRVTRASIDRCARQVQVFGDDIILPKSALGVLCEILSYLGLAVNADKTFGTGQFRESCGTDAWSGYEVEPCFLSVPPYSHNVQPDHVKSFLDTSNGMYKKGYWNVSTWILSLIHRYARSIPLVSMDSGFSGIASCMGPYTSHLKKVYCTSTQQWKVKSYIFTSKVKTLMQSGEYSLFQYFTERPSPEMDWQAGITGQIASYVRLGSVPIYSIER